MFHLEGVMVFILFSFVVGKIEIVPKIPNFVEYGSNSVCRQECKTYKENLKNYTLWAHKMLDSSAKSTFGILRGNSYQFGNYEECINIVGQFPTQYCLISLIIDAPNQNASKNFRREQHNPFGSIFTKLQKPYGEQIQENNNLRIGLCLPASCSAEDLEYSLTEHLKRTKKSFEGTGAKYRVSTSKDLCVSNSKPKEFGKLEILFCAYSAILILFVIIATLLKDSHTKTEKLWDKFHLRRKFYLSFSANVNWKSFCRSHEENEETKIFDFVRTIMLLIIIIAHKGEFISWAPWMNTEMKNDLAYTKFGYFLEQLDVTVDVFFLMSGLLLSYGILKKAKSGKISPFLIILLRYIRLTPLNLYVCLFMITMLNFCGSGPVWNLLVQPQIENCRQNIWANVFYFNTFVNNFDQYCNPVSWFISCDFQLFVIGTFVMFIIQWKKALGYSILGFLLVLSVIFSFVLTLVYKMVPVCGLIEDEKCKTYINFMSQQLHSHLSTYFVGILGGILYHHLKSKDVKISKKLTYLIFFLSLFFLLWTLGYLSMFYEGYENYNAVQSAMYNSLHRLVWSISIMGLFVGTSFSTISCFREGLSSTFWIPISKLCYATYLIHVPLMIISFSSTLTVINITTFYTISTLLAEIVTSLLVSFLLHIIIEVPIIKLFKFTFLPGFFHTAKVRE